MRLSHYCSRYSHLPFESARYDSTAYRKHETANWVAIQDYRHGRFIGVNNEHPNGGNDDRLFASQKIW